MFSIVVDAHEGRDVATADVTGAYLRAYMDDEVIMKFTGQFVYILRGIRPAYEALVVYKNGIKVLYVFLEKAMYRCVKLDLLWYNLFTDTLKGTYEPCMANCHIDGKQCTIAWYVDNTKISHVDPNVVSSVIIKIEQYSTRRPLRVARSIPFWVCMFASPTTRPS
jgi:hypothetical protein